MFEEYLCMILSFMVFYMPVLREWGCILDRGICLIVDDIDAARKILKRIMFSYVEVSVETGLRRIKKALANSNSGAVICPLGGKNYSDYKVNSVMAEMVKATFRAGEQGNEGYYGVPIFLSCCLPEDNANLFCIQIDGLPGATWDDIAIMRPAACDFAEIRRLAEEKMNGDMDCCERMLIYAAHFYRPYFLKHEMDFDEMTNCISQICMTADMLADANRYFIRYIETLYDWFGNVNYGKVIHLPRITDKGVDFDNAIFCDDDENNIFISSKHFERIFPDMNLRVIKEALAGHGALISSETGTYLSHMIYQDENGIKKRKRMLKLDVTKLEQCGAASIIDLMGGGNENEENLW